MKSTKYPRSPMEAVPAWEENEITNTNPSIGGIRIGVISYEHHSIQTSRDGTMVSIGALIDEHIHNVINQGRLVNEVSLFFETEAHQQELAKLYR